VKEPRKLRELNTERKGGKTHFAGHTIGRLYCKNTSERIRQSVTKRQREWW